MMMMMHINTYCNILHQIKKKIVTIHKSEIIILYFCTICETLNQLFFLVVPSCRHGCHWLKVVQKRWDFTTHEHWKIPTNIPQDTTEEKYENFIKIYLQRISFAPAIRFRKPTYYEHVKKWTKFYLHRTKRKNSK